MDLTCFVSVNIYIVTSRVGHVLQKDTCFDYWVNIRMYSLADEPYCLISRIFTFAFKVKCIQALTVKKLFHCHRFCNLWAGTIARIWDCATILICHDLHPFGTFYCMFYLVTCHLVLSQLGFENALSLRPLTLTHTLHQYITLFSNLTFTEVDIFTAYRFQKGICNGCCMLTGDSYSSGHLVPSLRDLLIF